jgi:23S rRNA (uracil1939-C5)-methyltransferase
MAVTRWARADGKVVMTPLALPGELVRIEVKNQKAQLIRARVAQVLEPSAERVVPRCPHFGACGGAITSTPATNIRWRRRSKS